MTGDELREKREKWRMTQAELAEAVGVKENTVYRWESGRLPISKTVELALATVERQFNEKEWAKGD